MVKASKGWVRRCQAFPFKLVLECFGASLLTKPSTTRVRSAHTSSSLKILITFSKKTYTNHISKNFTFMRFSTPHRSAPKSFV